MPDEDLENKLRNFGNITGKNLFVNIGRLNDPKYGKMKNIFGNKDFPVIIITGIAGLAAVKSESYYSTAYVRIDSKDLLKSVDLTIKSIEKLFNLFIGGEISKALKEAENDKRDAIIIHLKGIIISALKKIGKFLSDRDITVSLLEGKFELKKSGGSASV